MKSFSLTFIPRAKLIGLLANATGGPIGRIRMLSSVLGKLEFTEADQKQIVNVTVPGPNGEPLSGIQAPDTEFGKLAVEVEDAQAEILCGEIERAFDDKKFTVADLKLWAGDVLDALRKNG